MAGAGGARRHHTLDEALQVDSHHYLRGRERPPPEDQAEIFGRRNGDVDKLFPRFTHASAAVTGEVQVNGKTLKLWTFQQLETLNRLALRERAMTLRDALGEAQCAPIPSGQGEDVIRWILHMQAQLTSEEPPVGRTAAGGYGPQGHLVPQSFAKDSRERPVTMERQPGRKSEPVPFGPRPIHEEAWTRDNFSDLVHQRNEFKEVPNLGIQTGRKGGEGKRHLPTAHNMISSGVSTAEPRGIQSLRPAGEGRRHLACDDHVMELRTEPPELRSAGAPGTRDGTEPVRHVSESHMSAPGLASPPTERPVCGERRRHAWAPDSMVAHGTSMIEEEALAGRRYLDGFSGARSKFGDAHENYQSTWKKDPSRLLGSNLLV